MRAVPQKVSAPPSDTPKLDDLAEMMLRLGRPGTGWALQVGVDSANQPILLFRDEIQPPGWIRRLLSSAIGLKWVRVDKTMS